MIHNIQIVLPIFPTFRLKNFRCLFNLEVKVFVQLRGADNGNVFQDMDSFKREVRIQLFFSQPIRMHLPGTFYMEAPVDMSFKLKSSFNPVEPIHLESTFSSVECDLQKQKYKTPRKKNLTNKNTNPLKTLHMTMTLSLNLQIREVAWS